MSDIILDMDNMPKHLAIIMDGNGRWAKKQGKIRTFGHKFGVDTVKNIIKEVNALGIKYLTLYAFSTENWKRPKDEVSTLMNLVIEYLKKENDYLMAENVRMDFIGDITKLPKKTYENVKYTRELTGNNTGLNVNIALNYGGRDEIVMACKEIAKLVNADEMDIEDITEDSFSDKIYTRKSPNVDLLIRTGGDIRISNFLLWQIAYSEFYFTDVLWPDFDRKELHKAIYSFQHKERRFGGLV